MKKLSQSFWNVANGKKAGEELAGAIAKAKGRNGSGIQNTTVKRWADAGLVKVKTRAAKAGEHYLATPIESVKLTREGANRLKARLVRENSRRSR